MTDEIVENTWVWQDAQVNITDYYVNIIACFMMCVDSSFWLGMSDETIEDMWKWQATDSPVNFTDWLPSEPQNIHGNEDCAIMAFHSIFGWADVNCVSTSRPLCELR